MKTAETQGAIRQSFSEVLNANVTPLGHISFFLNLSYLCRAREYRTAMETAVSFRKTDPVASFAAVRFVFGVMNPRAITSGLKHVRVALIGKELRRFEVEPVSNALELLVGVKPQWPGLSAWTPVFGGPIVGEAFRQFAEVMKDVSGNIVNTDSIIAQLQVGGADYFFVQPG